MPISQYEKLSVRTNKKMTAVPKERVVERKECRGKAETKPPCVTYHGDAYDEESIYYQWRRT